MCLCHNTFNKLWIRRPFPIKQDASLTLPWDGAMWDNNSICAAIEHDGGCSCGASKAQPALEVTDILEVKPVNTKRHIKDSYSSFKVAE